MNSDPAERLATARREFSEWGGVNPSIDLSTTFTVLNPSDLEKIFSGARGPERGGCYLYGRSFSPTVRVLSRALAALEGTQSAYATASGMAAISSTLLALCDAGDRVVCSSAVYGGTHALLKSFLPLKCNIKTTFVDIADLAAVEEALKGGGAGDGKAPAKVLFCETVANPTLVVADLPKLSALARRHGASFVVDNTFSPCAVSPARHGADVVVHSCTKFISGQSDCLAGAVCGSAAFVARLMDLHTGSIMLLGPTLDPRVAGELNSRLAHLPLRVREHARRAMALATLLERECGARVTYPGLASHTGRALYVRLSNRDETQEGGEGGDGSGSGDGRDSGVPAYGFGGIFGLTMPGGAPQAHQLMLRLQNKHAFGLVAVSLGFSETLMSLSASSTSSELSPGELRGAGIGAGYVRISVGLTGTLEQRWSQMREAYEFVTRHWDGAAAAAAVAVEGAAATTTAAMAKAVAVPYLATRVLRGADGVETDLEQWPSSGSDLDEDGAIDQSLREMSLGDGEEEQQAAVAATTGARPIAGAASSAAAADGAIAAAHAGSLPKVRRVASDMLIRYTPLA